MNEIIRTLKENPKKTIYVVAKMMGLTPLQISQAQHEYLKLFRKNSSKLWDIPGYGRSGRV